MKHMWSEEEIQSFKKDISNLVDSKGNPRFIEGNGSTTTIEGFTSTYCKWSLSGSHLMCVLAGTIANGTTISGSINIASFSLPNYILNKIYPLEGFSGLIEIKDIKFYATDYTSQTLTVSFQKNADNKIMRIISAGSLTASKDRSFRIQFDLLIDTE